MSRKPRVNIHPAALLLSGSASCGSALPVPTAPLASPLLQPRQRQGVDALCMQATQQKAHFPVFATQDCTHSQPCFAAAVLFQALLPWHHIFLTAGGWVCPSCSPVHRHRGMDWTCRGQGVSEKPWAGLCIHTELCRSDKLSLSASSFSRGHS